jgi:hypothetical protein
MIDNLSFLSDLFQEMRVFHMLRVVTHKNNTLCDLPLNLGPTLIEILFFPLINCTTEVVLPLKILYHAKRPLWAGDLNAVPSQLGGV